ncbi:hypothetical protein Pcinc_019022 [Petrolisthes cinctipes]|uniref:Uncharacterized protein n=1 Tax=Petrolisthes cinctipes TaxID=88211 RepID=A0AAE1KM28_PETCI|nr:hypothetical protein Pcinc_019022 [Petrolisthes cinctipes]
MAISLSLLRCPFVLNHFHIPPRLPAFLLTDSPHVSPPIDTLSSQFLCPPCLLIFILVSPLLSFSSQPLSYLFLHCCISPHLFPFMYLPFPILVPSPPFPYLPFPLLFPFMYLPPPILVPFPILLVTPSSSSLCHLQSRRLSLLTPTPTLAVTSSLSCPSPRS